MSMLGKQRYYSLTLDDGRILTFPTEQARDEWLDNGGEAERIKRNYESEEE
jgi:hypothetical protein